MESKFSIFQFINFVVNIFHHVAKKSLKVKKKKKKLK